MEKWWSCINESDTSDRSASGRLCRGLQQPRAVAPARLARKDQRGRAELVFQQPPAGSLGRHSARPDRPSDVGCPGYLEESPRRGHVECRYDLYRREWGRDHRLHPRLHHRLRRDGDRGPPAVRGGHVAPARAPAVAATVGTRPAVGFTEHASPPPTTADYTLGSTTVSVVTATVGN